MQEREEQDDCSMRVVPREIEWIVPSRSIVTKYSGTGRFLCRACTANNISNPVPGQQIQEEMKHGIYDRC